MLSSLGCPLPSSQTKGQGSSLGRFLSAQQVDRGLQGQLCPCLLSSVETRAAGTNTRLAAGTPWVAFKDNGRERGGEIFIRDLLDVAFQYESRESLSLKSLSGNFNDYFVGGSWACFGAQTISHQPSSERPKYSGSFSDYS